MPDVLRHCLALLALSLAAAPAVDAATLVVLDKARAEARLVDPVTGRTRATVPTGHGPHEAATTADGTLLVVADYGAQVPGHTLTVIDVRRARVVRTIDLSPHQRPHGLAWTRGGDRLLVTSETSQALLLVDVSKGVVEKTFPTAQAASHMVARAPDGRRAYVANIAAGSVSSIDLAGGGEPVVIETGAGCEGVDVSPDGREVWTSNRAANTASVIDAATGAEVAEIAVGRFPIRVKLTPDGRRALVTNAEGGDLSVIDVATRTETKRIPLGAPTSQGSQGAVPIGVLVEPGGARAYVALAGAREVAVVDLQRLEVTARFEAGAQPDGMAWTVVEPAADSPRDLARLERILGLLETQRRRGDTSEHHASDSRTWYEERTGPGEPRRAGRGAWADWDEHFHSQSEVEEIRVRPDGMEIVVRETNDWYRLIDRPASRVRLTYSFDDFDRITGTLVQGIREPGATADRLGEFEAWARVHEPDTLSFLMPEGSIVPDLERAQRWREALGRWRRSAGLPVPE